MRATVNDVHHRRRQDAGAGPAEVAVEGDPAVLSGGVGDGHRHPEDRVGAEVLLVRRAVELEHPLVDPSLIEGVAALQLVSDLRVDVLDRFEHAPAEIDRLVAVALLPGLVGTGARPRRHGGPPEGSVGQRDIDLEGGVAAAVEDLAGVDVDNR